MEVNNEKKKEILACIELCKYRINLLIEQCDSWLSEEEGIKNMQTHFRNQRKKKRKK